MKAGWQWKPLGEACKTGSGGTPLKDRKEYYEGGTIPWLMSGEVSQGEIREATKFITQKGLENSAAKIFPKDTVLVAMYGATAGQVGILRFEATTNQAVCGIYPNSQFLPEFLFYFLLSKKDELVAQATGNAQPNISQIKIKNTEVPFPPHPEQQRIVGILAEAFDGIATAKATAEQNLQNARALFESHLQSVFSQHGDDWKMEKLDNLTDLARGHNPPKSKFSREQKPGYVRFYQIRDGATDDYTVFVPDTPQLHKMKKDDIMLVAYRHIGRAFRGVEGAFNVALCKISNARRDLLDDDFLFHLIPSQYVKGELLKRSERSLIPSMSIEHLREIKIPLPPIQEQKRLVETINRLTIETQHLESLYQRKLAALAELKKSLLHQAFSGVL